MALKLRDPLAVKVGEKRTLPFVAGSSKITDCVIFVLAPNGGTTPIYLTSNNETNGDIDTDWIDAYKEKHLGNDYSEEMIDLVVDRLREQVVHLSSGASEAKGGRFATRFDTPGVAYASRLHHFGVSAPDASPFDNIFHTSAFHDAAARSLKACLKPAWSDAQEAAKRVVEDGADFNWVKYLAQDVENEVVSAILAKVPGEAPESHDHAYPVKLGELVMEGSFPHVAFDVGHASVDTSVTDELPDYMSDPEASLDDVVSWSGWNYDNMDFAPNASDMGHWNSSQKQAEQELFDLLLANGGSFLDNMGEHGDLEGHGLCGLSSIRTRDMNPIFLSGMIAAMDFDGLREPDGETEKVVTGDPDVNYLVADFRRSYVDYRLVEHVTKETKQRLQDPETTTELDNLMDEFSDVRDLVTAHVRSKNGLIPSNYDWKSTDLYKVAKDGEKLDDLEGTEMFRITKDDGSEKKVTVGDAVDRVSRLEGKQTDFVLLVGDSSAPNMWREYEEGERVWREWDAANSSNAYYSEKKGRVSGDELLYLISRGASYDGNKGDEGGSEATEENLAVKPSVMETEYGGELSRGWNRLDDRYFLLRDEGDMTDDETMRFLMITKGADRSRFMALHIASQAQFLSKTEQEQAK